MKYNVVIGYDRTNRMPSYVVAESIMQHASIPVNFTFLHRDMLQNLAGPQNRNDSTEFSSTRFLTPYLTDYSGWSLYVDNDMIIQADIKQLFDHADQTYSVMCVKHNQVCASNSKFLNRSQHQYKYKNWSSVMLFNNSACTQLTPEYIKQSPGLDLHQFAWLDDVAKIGQLPLEWNYLVGCENQTTNEPKLIHYTLGGPYFPETADCQYAEKWTSVADTLTRS